MRYSYLLVLVLCLAVNSAHSQESGIRFRTDAFAAVLAESRTAGKPVFIDCYTSWCSPCKWMEKNIFVNDTAAQFYNDHFIPFKIDMEKGEGPALRERYGVKVFPTYLYLDGNGTLLHKATSRMELTEFIAEGRKALDPRRSLSALEKAFKGGDRSNETLVYYAIALQRIDRDLADSVSHLFIDRATDAELSSDPGWLAIQQFARDENDRPGKYFLVHQSDFTAHYGAAETGKVQQRLMTSTLYGLLYRKDSSTFFSRVAAWERSADTTLQKKAVQIKADYYLHSGNIKDFVAITSKALKGLLRYDAFALGFMAHRSQHEAHGNKQVLQQAYKMGKRAVMLEPEEYSHQSGLATICKEMGNKPEALAAAEKAYQLSLQETSKIQGRAKKELEAIQAM